MSSDEPRETHASRGGGPEVAPGLVEALATAYAALVKRQRTASSSFVRWSSRTRRSHEFAWMAAGEENLMSRGISLRVSASTELGTSLNQMMATIQLNPYERELLYGYPYIVGQLQGVPIRAPILTIPISISADGATLTVAPNEEIVRFNSLPFRSEADPAAHELSLARLIERTPAYPVGEQDLLQFCEALARELGVALEGKLERRLGISPSEPRQNSPLRIVDNAACFVAPKTSYFVASDLEAIAREGAQSVTSTALGWLVGNRPPEPTSESFGDHKGVYFPFPSNPSQRRVAHLAERPENRIIVVQGPPGTGKSQTIANTVCHLAARGKRVLVTSQKDKALQVVDTLLRQVNLAQLPMTLLRQDRESRNELRQRLEAVQKERAAQETHTEYERRSSDYGETVEHAESLETQLDKALEAEHLVAEADRAASEAQGFFRRLAARWKFQQTSRRAHKLSAQRSDDLGQWAADTREKLLRSAVELLRVGSELQTGVATKTARNHLREFAKLLGRNQTTFKNFSVFDRMKSEPDRCKMLLSILPCWIMTPDDACRLFPCAPALFDYVIIDEASQCDLPSMTPILFRAKQCIVVGDSKQMQAQRFAFTGNQVADQAWREQGMDRRDPDGWLHPAKIDLLQLAAIRMDEEVLLDEHFRSLPPIISFSNERWYGGRLRLMRDADDRRIGDPEAPTITVHRVDGGKVDPGTQENRAEAEALVDFLASRLAHPGYAEATFGVICLFEEQMRLVSELVTERIPEEGRLAHDLVVVNPDGFQGDERDVVLYSLSYDADAMPLSALSARQADHPHIQGMLNVAFTRGRDELHIFHSAAVASFGLSSGRGAIKDWLEHCTSAATAPRAHPNGGATKADSEFEAQVTQALEAKGIHTIAQFPSCGFFIDIVAERDGRRLAIECDGERWHLDEHGHLKVEDIHRQEILERAGWRVVRVPYRGWVEDADWHLGRIVDALSPAAATEPGADGAKAVEPSGKPVRLSRYEAAIVEALRNGARETEAVLRGARVQLGASRLGTRIKRSLEAAVQTLERKKLIVREDGELFLADAIREAEIGREPEPRHSTGPFPFFYRGSRRRGRL